MAKRARLKFPVDTLASGVGIWFVAWRLPLFAGRRTTVVTESAETCGEYNYPLMLGPECFHALIAGVRPRVLALDAGTLMMKYGVETHVLELLAMNPGAERLIEVVQRPLLALEAAPAVAPATLDWDYRRVGRLAKSKYWRDALFEGMARALPGAALTWLDAKGGIREGLPPADGGARFIRAAGGGAFIVYDAESDRLSGGGGAPDLLRSMQI